MRSLSLHYCFKQVFWPQWHYSKNSQSLEIDLDPVQSENVKLFRFHWIKSYFCLVDTYFIDACLVKTPSVYFLPNYSHIFQWLKFTKIYEIQHFLRIWSDIWKIWEPNSCLEAKKVDTSFASWKVVCDKIKFLLMKF